MPMNVMAKARSTKPKARSPRRKPSTAPAPKVFLSHASEDKERFVVDFATRLRERGIDVWLDRWEMLPGDSLVRKIFDEGLAQADAVIVVVSKFSIAKPWVREELDIAVVNKINRSSKLIPVVIDDCAVPQCLQATLWEKIGDLKNYGPSLERIVLSIFGRSSKPPLGAGPAFSAKPTIMIGDLTRVDSLVLQTACEVCLEKNEHSSLYLAAEDLVVKTRKLEIRDPDVSESVSVLESRGYLTALPGGDIPSGNLQITFTGFELYLKAHRSDYEQLLKKFGSLVVNDGLWEGEAIERAMKLPVVLLEHIVDVFEEKRWLLVAHFGGGGWEIAEGGVKPEMKRWLEK